MTKLAEQFGISDVGLKKTCDRHRVPTPPRSYWAKLEAGQKPKRAVFVEVRDAQLDQIEVTSYVADLPQPVRQIMAPAATGSTMSVPAGDGLIRCSAGMLRSSQVLQLSRSRTTIFRL